MNELLNLLIQIEKINAKENVPLESVELLKLKDSLFMGSYNFYPFLNLYVNVVNGKIRLDITLYLVCALIYV